MTHYVLEQIVCVYGDKCDSSKVWQVMAEQHPEFVQSAPELTSSESCKNLLQSSVQKYTSLVMRPLNQDLLTGQLFI